jgi:hypothetical protein
MTRFPVRTWQPFALGMVTDMSFPVSIGRDIGALHLPRAMVVFCTSLGFESFVCELS